MTFLENACSEFKPAVLACVAAMIVSLGGCGSPGSNVEDLKRDFVELCNHQALVMGAEMVQSGRISGEEAMAHLQECGQKKEALREAGLTEQDLIDLANQDR